MAAAEIESGDRDRPIVCADAARGVVVGDYGSQINVFLDPQQTVRSAYLEQVRRIAPTVLTGRELELAALVDFSIAEERGSYLWWQAPAWAGKSALMSWFVLHPPPGVVVVSFFVTAGLPGQDERRAFVDNVLEQLAGLLGHAGVPAYLSDATRDMHLLAMLAEATSVCRERGQRLVLVVDGLDEDRGVQQGADTHTIAALLPARPPPGLRIVVASRATPPIPFDVGDDHPLRDPSVVRTLAISPHATIVRVDAEREITRLSQGGVVQRDLLGLVTVTGGGLSGCDLAELTGHDQRQVEDVLDTAAGRTFSRRPARWQPESAPETYTMGHVGLQLIAERRVGAAALEGFRQRVHAWADQYREQGWPAETPQYLLGGYFRVLHQSDHLSKMITYASDTARHGRLLRQSGGDGTALDEIATAQDGILGQSDPDLAAMCTLAVLRDGLLQRNDNLPAQLPALWARLGQVSRARELVQSISDGGGRRAVAVALLARAVAAGGDFGLAESLARTLPERTFIAPNVRAETLCALTSTVAAAGDYHRAESLADSIRDPYRQAQALGEIAMAISRAGDLDAAQIRARGVAEPYWQAQVLAVLARHAARSGRHDLANSLTAQADDQTTAVAEVDQRASVVGFLAHLAGQDGDQGRAATLADRCSDLLRAITDPQRRATTMVSLASLDAPDGGPWVSKLLGQAEDAVRTIPDPIQQAKALARIATVLAQVGDVNHAEALVRSVTDQTARESAVADLVAALAAVGNHDRAEEIAQSVAEPHQQGGALAALARHLAIHGNVRRAESVARSVEDPRRRASALTDIAAVLADSAEHSRALLLAEEAEALSRTIIEPWRQTKPLLEMASVLASIGQPDRAVDLAARAEVIAARITSTMERKQFLAELVEVSLAVDDDERAEAAANAVADPSDRVALLTRVITTLLRSGRRGRAMAMLGRTESVIRLIAKEYQRTEAVTKLSSLLADAGEYDRAVALTSYQDDGKPWDALGHIARIAAAAGDVERAEQITGLIENRYTRTKVHVDLVAILAAAGDYDGAEAITRSITDQHRRVQAVITLAQHADPVRARKLIAWALRNGTWSDPLTALARIQPDAVRAAADRLIHLTDIQHPGTDRSPGWECR